MIISIGEIHSYNSGCNQSSTKNLYEINNLIGDIFKIKDKSFVTLLIEIINNPLKLARSFIAKNNKRKVS